MIDTKLKGKVAIVTGANNPYGIGAGIAKALASELINRDTSYFIINPSVPTSDHRESKKEFKLKRI